MNLPTDSKGKVELSAVVTRADGTVEDLGVIAVTETFVEHFDCPACGKDIHINAPAGSYPLACGYCLAEHVVLVGPVEPLRGK